MAYVPMSQDEEEKRRSAGSTPPGSFGDTTPTSPTTQSKFVNVMDYLNKNPDASGQLGDAAAGKLNTQKLDAETSLKDTTARFGQDVSGGSVNLDQGLLDTALANPTQFAQSPENLAKFTALRDATYKGPQSLESTDYFAPTQSKITGLGTTAASIGNEAGRNSLVQDLSAHPTQGKTALNQLLLQGSDAAAQKVEQAAGSFKNVEDQWQKFLTDAPGMVSAAKTGTDATRTATQTGLKSTTDQFLSQLQAKTAQATNDRDSFNLDYQNIDKAISEGGSGLSQKQLDELGISDAYPYLSKLQSFNDPHALGYYGSPVQLSNYTQGGHPSANVPTAESVASSDDYAREAALQQMAGVDLGLPDQQVNPYVKDGKLPTVMYKDAFDKAGSDLKNFDANWQPKVAGYGPDDLDQLYAIQGRRGVATGTPNDSFYTDPAAGATPSGGFGIAPAPEGWDASQPVPYPQPTSNPPGQLINPQWNPYTGQWQGVQLQPNTPPPSGGGRHTF